MRRALLTSIRMALVTIVLTGVVYPMAVWAVGAVAFPAQTAGSLATRNGRVVGSSLIAQSFTSDRYFHPRPSAAGSGYDAMASGPSNLGPTSRKLMSAVASGVAQVEKSDGVAKGAVPVDLVTASASGLDPDITPDSAYIQVGRVAKARGLDPVKVRDLLTKQIAERTFGFIGEPRVNVLELNLSLDAMK